MKQIDTIDSLKHLNFPDSLKKEKREKIGSFFLTMFGLAGLLAMSNPSFNYSDSNAPFNKKVNKFWLTPTALNAENTASSTISIHAIKATNNELFSASLVAKRQTSY